MRIANYHTHTALCGHARGTIDEYIENAIAYGLKELGFSDHCPFPGDGFGERMQYADLPEYFRSLDAAKKKYDGKINIVTGCEVEYFEVYRPYYEQLFERGMQYMILGQHYTMLPDGSIRWLFHGRLGMDGFEAYVNNVIAAMKTGYFTYVAHPDLFALSDVLHNKDTQRLLDRFLDEAVKGSWRLELNANGIRKGKSWQRDGEYRYQYSIDMFWEQVAKAGIEVMIGADAHWPEAIYDESVHACDDMAKRLGLKITDKLDIR